jgi:DNA-binding NarL/FixJ family response regulator
MPKEILLQIINQRLVFSFIVILMIYFVVNWVIFKLSFQMLGVAIKTHQMLAGILLAVLNNLIGKQIFRNDLIYLLASIMLLTILMKAIGREKVTWMRAFWAIFIAMAATLIGATVILTPLSLSPALARLRLTPLAAAFGSASEGVIPAILLFLLKTLNISIIPPVKRRIKPLDIGNLIIFVIPFIWLYQDTLRTFKNWGKYNLLELLGEFLFQLFLAGGLLIIYYWVYTTTRHQHQQEKEKVLQLEHDKQELRQEKERLAILYEQVQSKTIEPQVAIDTAQNIIERLQNSIVKQQEIYTENNNDESDTNSINIHLTKREREVLELLVRGLLNKQIADKLGIAETWVNNIVKHITEKAKVSGKLQLVIFAIQNKLIDVNAIKIEDIKDNE